MNLPVLLLLLPSFGAVLTAALPSAKLARQTALFVSLLTAVVAMAMVLKFYGATTPDGFNYKGAEFLNFSIHMRVDAISLWLVALTAGITPLAILASFGSIHEREKEYYAWMLALLVAMLGVFVSWDILLFYVFFELTLIPMFFIIGIWGGPERRFAAAKFFLFTFAGSVFTLAAAVYVGLRAGSFDFDVVMQFAQTSMSDAERFWVVLGLIAGFAVKVPLFPVHTWLPLAHTEAPTAGSVILAGILLKLGTYGLLRLALPLGMVFRTSQVSATHYLPSLLWWLGVLCIIGIIYGALCAWVQRDIKKLVAYSSVSHLGFCVLGLIALNDIGIQGSVMYMINHGINTGALFLCVGMIYDRYHTRDIDQLSGLAKRMPVLAFFFVLFTLASIGLPGTNGFVSEFLTILGAFTSDHLGVGFGTMAALGIVLGALYMLHMVARVIFGPLKTPVPGAAQGHAGPGHVGQGPAFGQEHEGQGPVPTHEDAAGHEPAGHDAFPGDLTPREIGILAPLALAVIILGVKPGLIMDGMLAPIQAIRTPAAAVVVPGGKAPNDGPVIMPLHQQTHDTPTTTDGAKLAAR